MKTKITILTAFLALISNVCLLGAGTVSLGYSSDYVRRGGLVSAEALQASAGYSASVSGLELSGSVFSNQPTGQEEDTYLIKGGAGVQLGELLNLYVGLEHFETVDGDADLDVAVEAGFSSALNPNLYIAKDTDDDLYTFEGSVSHDVTLQDLTVSLGALYGYTDLTETTDETYYVLSAGTSVSISESADIELTYDYVDSDLSAEDNVFGIALNVNF
jgi:hypothetical protein